MSVELDPGRLRATLGDPALAWFVERVRRRLEEGRGVGGRVTLRSPTAAQRAAADTLLGRRPARGTTLGLEPLQVERILREAGICESLVEGIEALTGPLRNLAAEREQERSAWSALYAQLAGDLQARPALSAWWDGVRGSGYLKRLTEGDLAAARGLVEQVSAVLARLPAQAVRLAVLAAEVTGDPHALDVDTPLGGLLVRAAAALGGVEPPQDAKDRRDAWASVGVLLDGLSAPALVLNLRAEPGSLTGQVLSLHATRGEPCRVSVRQLLRDPPSFTTEGVGPLVFVCENPSVVDAAADHLGPNSAPLVCTEGQPATAVRLLLRRLTEAGVQLAVHADFDGAGLRIADLIRRRHAALRWRFRAQDYVVAPRGLPLTGPGGAHVEGSPALSAALQAGGRVVSEESVLSDLLGDLGRRSSASFGRTLPAAAVQAGLRCARRLYREAASGSVSFETSPWLENQRRAVEARVREGSPGGVEVPATGAQEATQELLEGDAPALFGAVLSGGGLTARVDVLKRRARGWGLVRVSSATEVRPRDVERLAIWLWVAQAAGLEVERALVAHVDADAGDPDAVIVLADCTHAARRRALTLPWEIEAAHRLLALDAPPAVDVGPHCGRGTRRECPYLGDCWPYPGPTVFDLPRAGALAWQLHRQGRACLSSGELPSELTPIQRRVGHAIQTGERYLDRDGARQAVNNWPQPLAFLDLETLASAVPRYSGATPYQPVPFQFSCHVSTSDGALRHSHYLHTDPSDPRPALAATLVQALATHTGGIVVYHLPFESTRLAELADAVPQHAEALQAIRARLLDLLPVVTEFVYDPAFKASYSLKHVAPALLGPQASFTDLAVGDGNEAQAAFEELIASSTSTARRVQLEQLLRTYCTRDTQVLAELTTYLASAHAQNSIR